MPPIIFRTALTLFCLHVMFISEMQAYLSLQTNTTDTQVTTQPAATVRPGNDNIPPAEKNLDMRPGTAEYPVMQAVRLHPGEPVVLDGFLSDPAWRNTPVATRFTQRFPHDGQPATEKTEVRILYTDHAIYVGIMAYDSAPDSIMAPLFRRDGNLPSDWVYVSFDSYNDRRTAFTFAVNPRGVQKDILVYNDTNEDVLWDAVWEAKTQILDNGWSAEMRIPLSQLRFSADLDELEWGINFQRRIGRKGEISMWAPTPQTDNRHVSRFGRLNGISGLNEPRRLEIAPYTAANILRAPDPGNGNPYYNRNQFSGSLGGDIRYGLTSDFTLTATINPDFGQVEADPAMINLTANENFFSERRPFFIEGSDIFRFGDTRTFSRYGNPATFYSRRIGRSPQGSPGRAGLEADFTNMPDQTTIATAVKVSGKTASGWSVGILDAITLQEKALFTTPSGSEQSVAVEPATNYLVTRAKKDFNSGSTFVGGFASAVNRRIGGTYFENFLRSSAYTAGGDFEHYFLKRNWVASGTISWTTINGTPEAMQLAQRSPVRYYNRVDSGRLSIDPDRTSLSGYATEMSIQKRGGEDRWLGSLTYAEASPGYETNDLGFQNRADYRAVNGGVVYRNTRPEKVQYYEYWLFSAHTWNFDGDRINKNIGTGGFIRFKNMWHANYNMNYNGRQFSDRISRGGPLVELPVNGNMNMNISSNPNKSLAYNAGTFMRRDTEGGYNRNFWAGFRVQPTPWLQFSFAPELMLQRNMYQYIATVADAAASQTFGRRYVFSEIDQTTLLGNFRLNWTFSPSMSLQTYVRPYISTGRYRNFKELQAPGTRRFAVYGRDTGTISRANGRYTVEPDGSGESAFSFNAPDFNFRSIQGNAVFRWEYTRGSTIFLVWQQQRSDLAHDGGFNPGRDLGELFRTRPTNVFLVKVSYWFGS